MKYIYLIGSFVFGISGISQAMDAAKSANVSIVQAMPLVLKLEHISIAVQPTPGFIKVMILSIGFFLLYLIRSRLKDLGLNSIHDYFPS